MKVLLFLNGFEGSQSGIEEGFKYILKSEKISSFDKFYWEDYLKNNNSKKTIEKMLNVALIFQPILIVFFHIGNFKINESFIFELKNMKSKPILAYDEGDMYGGWSKPITFSMKSLMKMVDVVSIRGLGKWYETTKKYNSNIIYTPHSNSLMSKTKNIIPKTNKNNEFVFIGNRVKSKVGNIRRLPGASEREKFVLEISKYFPNQFNIYGQGWDNIFGNKGILPFSEQTVVCENFWIQVSYEHYPNIPYYFSDRLPIALASGQIYVCHYHEGYENIFNGCDFIYFFNTTKESIDIVNYLLSLGTEQLYAKSIRAKEWADNNLSPEVVWTNFFNKIIKNK